MHSPSSHTHLGAQAPSKAMSVEDVARAHRKHVVTVRLALSDQSLHGTQQAFTGRWIIARACAEAWAKGEKCEHVATAADSTAAATVERWRMPSGSVATLNLTEPPAAVQAAREIRRATTVDEHLRNVDDGAYFRVEGSPSWGSNS